MLTELLKTSEENRNFSWDEKFFKYLSETELCLLSEEPQQGPDSWPYMMTDLKETQSSDQPYVKTDSAQKIIHWLSTRGIGLVVNPKREPYPDYVFSYGMLWSFRETGYFMQPPKTQNISKDFTVDSKNTLKTGPPSKEYLPEYVRVIVRNFLIDQGIFASRVLMIAPDGENYDLCFSLESLGSPPESEHQGILEALSWFMPPHYSLALVSEKSLPVFEAL